MEVASHDDVTFAASAHGAVHLARVPAGAGCARDAVADARHARGDRACGSRRSSRPSRGCTSRTRRFPRGWERKGAVMRELVERDARGATSDADPRRRRQGRFDPTAGCWCSRIRSIPSPTCGRKPTATTPRSGTRASTHGRFDNCSAESPIFRIPRTRRPSCSSPSTSSTAVSTNGWRSTENRARVGHHGLRAGCARRHRLRGSSRGRARGASPRGACAEVESTKSVSEIYAPVSGTIVEANDRARPTRPSCLNQEPYERRLDLRRSS